MLALSCQSLNLLVAVDSDDVFFATSSSDCCQKVGGRSVDQLAPAYTNLRAKVGPMFLLHTLHYQCLSPDFMPNYIRGLESCHEFL